MTNPDPDLDPAPAEIIAELDFIDFEWRGFGAVWPMSEKRAAKARAELAADLLARGEPFCWHGVRYPALPSG